MNALPSAFVVSSDAHSVSVMCPFCYKVHRHGAEAVVVGSHCLPGRSRDYIIGGQPNWDVIGLALKKRDSDILRKRKAPGDIGEAIGELRGVSSDAK